MYMLFDSIEIATDKVCTTLLPEKYTILKNIVVSVDTVFQKFYILNWNGIAA